MFRTLDEMCKTPIYRDFDHIPDEMLKELEVNYVVTYPDECWHCGT